MSRLPPNFHTYQHGNLAFPREWVLAPVMPFLPFVRWPLGYLTLAPTQAMFYGFPPFIAPLLFWLAWRAAGKPMPLNEGPQYLWCYIAATILLMLLRCGLRFLGQFRGEDIHQNEAGFSFLTHLFPLPVFVTEQLLMPALVAFTGWKLAQTVSIDLGGWLIIVAGSYFCLANWESRNRMAQRRALVDDQAHASLFSLHLDQHERKAARRGRRPPALDALAGKPDIVRLGNGRRR